MLNLTKMVTCGVANPYCNNGNSPIHVKSPDGQWRHYGSEETETSLSHTPISISFDSFGRTWVSSFLSIQ